jgi:hypothetical protein
MSNKYSYLIALSQMIDSRERQEIIYDFINTMRTLAKISSGSLKYSFHLFKINFIIIKSRIRDTGDHNGVLTLYYISRLSTSNNFIILGTVPILVVHRSHFFSPSLHLSSSPYSDDNNLLYVDYDQFTSLDF